MADGSIIINTELDYKQAQKDLNKLKKSIQTLQTSLAGKESQQNAIKEQIATAGAEADITGQKIEELKSKIADAKKVMADEWTKKSNPLAWMEANYALPGLQAELKEQEKIYAEQAKELDKLNAAHDRLAPKIAQETTQLQTQTQQAAMIERGKAEASARGVDQLRESTEGAGEAAAIAAPNFKKMFRTILKYGFGIRSTFILFRKLKQATKEAITSLAESDSETKASLDGLKTALSGLKAAWGAAFAPILNLVAPILQKLIGWLTNIISLIGQFFAALSGRTTFKKAVEGSGAVADNMKGAAGSAKEMSKTLMGIDEITKLDGDNDSGGSGGSGGGSGVEYVDEAINQKLLDNLNLIKHLVFDIGAALLAWAIGKHLGLGLWEIIGLMLAAAGAAELLMGFIDSIKNGLNMDNLTSMLIGATALIVGLGIVFGTTGAAIGALIGGIVLFVAGLIDFIRTGKMSEEAMIAITTGLLMIGGAVAVLTGSWIPLIIAGIAAVIAVGIYLYQNWDEVKEKLKEIWGHIKDFFMELVNGIKRRWDEFLNDFRDMKTRLNNTFVEPFKQALNNIKALFANFSFPHINTPHITVDWLPAGDLARFFGISALPHLSVQWYAKGGIVDGATLIGAGEKGPEAIVPLKDTAWMNVVADNIMERLASNDFAGKLAEAFANTPLPAMAGGGIAPPRAVSGDYEARMQRMIDTMDNLINAFTAYEGRPIEVSSKMYLDKREIGESVTSYQRERSRARG